jgi:hypothetical protein
MYVSLNGVATFLIVGLITWLLLQVAFWILGAAWRPIDRWLIIRSMRRAKTRAGEAGKHWLVP